MNIKNFAHTCKLENKANGGVKKDIQTYLNIQNFTQIYRQKKKPNGALKTNLQTYLVPRIWPIGWKLRNI